MRYFKCEMSNGLCGCNDNFLLEFDNNAKVREGSEVYEYAIESYAYSEVYCGAEYDYGEGCEFETYAEWYDHYLENIWEYSYIEEIDEEEALKLQEEEGYDIR